MLRDFSGKAKKDLLQYVEDVTANSVWEKIADSWGDCGYVVQKWLGKLSVSKYINNIEDYHRKIVDRHNTTQKQIEDIFKAVEAVDIKYDGLLQQSVTYGNSIKKLIEDLANTIDPNGGNMDMAKCSGTLEADIADMNDAKATSEKAIEDGMKGVEEKGAAMSADPVNLSTGNFVYDMEDMKIDGEIPISFHRYYNSKDNYMGALGRCFQHNYEISLQERKDGSIGIRLADGQGIYFIEEKGSYVGEGLAQGTLEKTDDGYLYRNKSGQKMLFNQEGKLLRQERPNGRGISFVYDENKLLVEAKSDNGSSLYYYYDEEHKYLKEVKDHTGRSVKLEYNEELLEKVTFGNKVYRYAYANNGRVAEVVNPCKNSSVKNEYDGSCRVLKQQFPDGSEMSFEYDDDNKSVTMIERNGSKTVHIHDDKYRNIETRYEDGTKESYLYNDRNQCICFTSRDGRVKRMAYDNRGNLVQIIYPLKQKINLTYDRYDNLLTVSVNGKMLRKNFYDGKGNLIGEEDYFGNGYKVKTNSNGQPVERTFADGSKMQLEYDERGNITSISNGFGGKTTYIYNPLNQVVQVIDAAGYNSQFEYNEFGNIVKETNALGDTKTFAYDEDNKLIYVKDYNGGEERRSYNALGKTEKIVDAEGRELNFEYDSMWNVSGMILPNGAKTQYNYDKNNHLTEIKDGLGHSIYYEYDVNGNCISQIDYDGEKTLLCYDALDRVVSVEVDDTMKFIYGYDNNDNLIRIDRGDGVVLHLAYDEMGRLIKEENTLGESRIYTYTSMNDIESITDERGNCIRYSYVPGGDKVAKVEFPEGGVETYSYDVRGNLSRVVDQFGNETTYTYDALERLVSVDENGSKKEFGYDAVGNVLWRKDPEGNITRFTYSLTGDILKVEDALGNEVEYTYDSMGQLIEVLQKGRIEGEEDRRISYERDLLGRVCSIKDALGYVEKFNYNNRGQLVEQMDKDGYLTKYFYNKQGDVSKVQYEDGREVELSYNPLRQLEEIKDWQGTTSFVVDEMGRATNITYPDGQQISYTYSKSGKRESLTYPNGDIVRYEYDKLNRLIALNDGTERLTYNYDSYGRIKEKIYPNDFKVQYDYNRMGLLQSILHSDKNGVLDSYQFHYDANGQKVASIKDRRNLAADSGNFEYRYDALGRMTEVVRDKEVLRKYEYDSFGNRISKEEDGKITRYQYNSLNQMVSSSDGVDEESYVYDKRGNIKEVYANGKLKNAYTYGCLNRLEKAENDRGMTAQYVYNGLGHRVAKHTENKSNGSINRIQYVLDMTNEYNNLLQKEENGKKSSFLWDGNLVGIRGNSTGNPMYFLQDDMGNPSRLSGLEQLESYGYDEFGNSLWNNQSVYHPFGFTGYQWDEVANSYYAQAREYVPQLGRFTAKDVIKGEQDDPLSQNEYLYCKNAPKDYVDLNGRIAIIAIVGITAAIGAVAGAGIELASQAIENKKKGKKEKIKWGAVAGAALEGAIVGAVAGLPIPGAGASAAIKAGCVALEIGAGGIGSAANSALSQAIDNKKVNWNKVAEDGLVGTVVSGVTMGIGKLLEPVTEPLEKGAKEWLKNKGIIKKISEKSDDILEAFGRNNETINAIKQTIKDRAEKGKGIGRQTRALTKRLKSSVDLTVKYTKAVFMEKGAEFIKKIGNKTFGVKAFDDIFGDRLKYISPIYKDSEDKRLADYLDEYGSEFGRLSLAGCP